MFKRAPVAFRWTRISLDRANRVKGPNAVDRAILFLFSSGIRSNVITYLGLRGLLYILQRCIVLPHSELSLTVSEAPILLVELY